MRYSDSCYHIVRPSAFVYIWLWQEGLHTIEHRLWNEYSRPKVREEFVHQGILTEYHFFANKIISLTFFQGKMRFLALFFVLCICNVGASHTDSSTDVPKAKQAAKNEDGSVGCVCGVFLTGQVERGSKNPPSGNPALMHEHPEAFTCTNYGTKLCTNKCLDVVSTESFTSFWELLRKRKTTFLG